MNIIEYFDQVKIINMKSRSDRRRDTVSEFVRNGFPIKTDKVSFFPAISPDCAEGFQSPGTRGCFLSHLEILKNAENLQLNNILILEDDIQFPRQIKEYGEIAVNALSLINDWDLAYFGHVLGNSPGEPVWKKVSEPMQLSHFYAVNRKAIGRLVLFLEAILRRPPGHPDGGPMHYDGALKTFKLQNADVNAYYFSKNLGFQRPSRTDVHDLSFFDTNPLFKPAISVYRQIKKEYLKRTV